MRHATTVKRGVKAIVEGAFWGLIALAALGLSLAGVTVVLATANGWLDWTLAIGLVVYVASRAGLHEWRHGGG